MTFTHCNPIQIAIIQLSEIIRDGESASRMFVAVSMSLFSSLRNDKRFTERHVRSIMLGSREDMSETLILIREAKSIVSAFQ